MPYRVLGGRNKARMSRVAEGIEKRWQCFSCVDGVRALARPSPNARNGIARRLVRKQPKEPSREPRGSVAAR